MNRSLALWIVVGWVGFLVAPWYVLEDGFWSFEWIVDGYPLDTDYAPAVLQATIGDANWLGPIGFFLLLPLLTVFCKRTDPTYSLILFFAGLGGLIWVLGQGFSIGISGWRYEWLDATFGA